MVRQHLQLIDVTLSKFQVIVEDREVSPAVSWGYKESDRT